MLTTMKTKKIQPIFIIVALACCLISFDCSKKKSGKSGEEELNKTETSKPLSPEDAKTILEINNQKTNLNDFKTYLKVHYPDMESVAPSPEKKPGLMSRLFDAFVEFKTIAYSAEMDKVTVSKDEIEKYLSKMKISSQNINQDAISEAVKVQKYIYFKVYDQVSVSDNEIQQYYKDNMADFRKKPEILLYQILVKDKETAQRIRGTLVNYPEKFEEIAQKESTSPEKDKGGLMGYFEKGSLPKDMEDVVFSLNPNTISPVVQSSYGFHIFKIGQKKKERLLYIEKARADIQNILMSEKMRKAYQAFLEETKKNFTIRIKYDELNFKYQTNNIEGDQGNANKKTN